MRYEVLEKFFADTRLHFCLVEVSEYSVERLLRQATGYSEPVPKDGRNASGWDRRNLPNQ